MTLEDQLLDAPASAQPDLLERCTDDIVNFAKESSPEEVRKQFYLFISENAFSFLPITFQLTFLQNNKCVRKT